MRVFVAEPEVYAALAEAGDGVRLPKGSLPVIDEGMRRWFESCACCLSDTYPEIKAQLDAERAATTQEPVDAQLLRRLRLRPA